MALKQSQEEVKLTGSDVAELIKQYQKEGSVGVKYTTLQQYYEGQHSILQRKMSSASSPNNKLVNNFPGYIADVNTGYFMGKPVTYSAEEEKGADQLKKDIQDIFNNNDEQAENAKLAKIASIKGKAYELLWMDEESAPKFAAVDPENMILVYDDKIIPTPLYGIRFKVVDKKTYAELYTRDTITQFEGEGEELLQVGDAAHPFLEVPIVEYLNNDEGIGDFENVLQLIDAYDKSQSDSANDFEYFADAYLKIKNMSATTGENVSEMKKNRVILVDEDGDADWLTKNIQDTAMENYKNRLQADIHRFSMTPNLTDEAFAGNLSGIALEFKLWGLEQSAAQKERKFKKGLQRRIKLLCNFLGLHDKNYDWRSIVITFSRNVPQQLSDAVKAVVDLNGIVSRETLLALLPFIEDAKKEMERIDAEASEGVDLMDMNDEQFDSDTSFSSSAPSTDKQISIQEVDQKE